MIQPKKIFRTKEGKLGFEWNDGTMEPAAPAMYEHSV